MKNQFLLCIGAQKAATSWLFNMLRSHEALWLPPIKELHFFDHLFVDENRKWTQFHIRKGVQNAIKWHCSQNDTPNLNFIQYLLNYLRPDIFTEAWYFRCFNRPVSKNKILGDVTPEYSTVPINGIHYIRGLLNQPKIIYIVRDPVERAMSQLRMNVSRHHKEKTISENEWREYSNHPAIENRGDYKTYIPNWCKVFEMENILFLPYKECRNNPAWVCSQLASYLNIDSSGFNSVILKKRIHTSKNYPLPEKMPSIVADHLKTKFKSQYQFLENYFGPDFCDKI